MSQDNIEIVRRAYARVNADLELPPDLYDPEFEVDSRDVGPGNFGVIRGLDAAQEALREYWETFEDFHVELEEVIHSDAKQVVNAVRDTGRVHGSDAELRNRLFHVWSLHDCRIVGLSIHTEREQALDAAGRSKR